MTIGLMFARRIQLLGGNLVFTNELNMSFYKQN